MFYPRKENLYVLIICFTVVCIFYELSKVVHIKNKYLNIRPYKNIFSNSVSRTKKDSSKKSSSDINVARYYEAKAVFNKTVYLNGRMENVTICSPKLHAKVQGIYQQIRDKFGGDYEAQVFPYKYIVENKNACSDNESIKAIMFILIAPEEFRNRRFVRRRWAHPRFIEGTGIKVVYILGLSANSTVNQEVLKESVEHQDIIQLNFQDHYKNLTLKTLSLLHWTKFNCKNVNWVIKSDTDVLVNIFLIPR